MSTIYIHRIKPCSTTVLLTFPGRKEGILKTFLPGMTPISEAELIRLQQSKQFKSEVDCGNLIIGGSHESETSNAVEAKSPKERAAKLASEINSMKTQDALDAINGMTDPGILKSILTTAHKKGLVEAARKRISDINNQVGSDLTPESIPAPEGTGEDFMSEITGSAKDKSGLVEHTAIPALKTSRRSKK